MISWLSRTTTLHMYDRNRRKTTVLHSSLFSESDQSDYASLPFPKPLDRNAFSSSDFSADAYLVQSHHYQTLEDIRADLRDLIAQIDGELIDLVNQSFSDFIDLGKRLEGEGDRVKDMISHLSQIQSNTEVRRGYRG